MDNSQLRNFIQKSLLSHLVFLLVVAGVGYGTFNITRHALSLSQESAKLREQAEELKRQKANLQARLRELETHEAVEREAKDRLNLKIPGEEVVVVVPEKKEGVREEEHGIWQKIKAFLLQ